MVDRFEEMKLTPLLQLTNVLGQEWLTLPLVLLVQMEKVLPVVDGFYPF